MKRVSTTKCVSWNINGLRAAVKKNFVDVFNKLDVDFFCLQEAKLRAGQINLELPDCHQYWSYTERKGCSDTAIPAKEEALSVRYGLGIEAHDQEGRVIILEYPESFVVTYYTPNSQAELERLAYRMAWEDAFRAYLDELNQEKPIVLRGDLDIAHQNIDLKNWKASQESAEFTPEKRQKFTELLDSGFTGTFHYFYPEAEGIYPWWGYHFNARKDNAGWRIDYFVVLESLNERLVSAKIYTDILGSDHCPVGVVLDF